VIIVCAILMENTDYASFIVEQFAEAGYQIDPDALILLTEQDTSPSLISRILDSLDESTLVVGPAQIDPAFNTRTTPQPGTEYPRVPRDPDYEDEWTGELDVISDITDQSTCVGEYREFVDFFRNRFSRLGDMLRNRGVGFRPIESLNRRKLGLVEGREEVSVIGMVSDLRTSKNGHRMIEIEDTTGSLRTMVLKNKHDIFEQGQKVMLDEVIGVSGNLSDDGNLLFINSIMWPDMPLRTSSELGERNVSGKAVMISDVHIGSDTFLEDQWLGFIDWLNHGGSVAGNGSMDVKDIRYLVVAGDLVDGIGIYPNQEEELAITDVYEQYKVAADYFNQIPKHIKVIISPGNHDAVRQAEPQPTFPEKIRKMFRPDVVFVGNPAVISMDGVRTLVYHGRSIDDIVANLPGMKYEDPTRPMIEMLKRRHLSPMYGSRVSIAPEREDHLVIDKPPHILHCGHVHTVGCTTYRGVTVINSGTWQSQTEFQRRMNLKPDPAKATIVDLATLNTNIISFQ
jgi:DNA polymerase II small subunit